jgi:hypothetical protein
MLLLQGGASICACVSTVAAGFPKGHITVWLLVHTLAEGPAPGQGRNVTAGHELLD